MSKTKSNVIEPLEIINELGADSLRLYLIKANAPWEDTAFQKDGPKNARKTLNTYWNVVNFASTYMNIDNYDPSAHTLDSVRKNLRDEDRWMLSRTEKVKKAVTQGLESRELHKVARALEDYIMEDLSRWYVRLVRDRSWSEGSEEYEDKIASYFVLHYSIMSTALMLAPLTPHISEEVYRHMGGTKLSVHMEDWVDCDDPLISDELERSMYLVQNVIEVIAAERAKMGSKLRWPLKQIFIVGEEGVNDSLSVFEDVLAQQGNIKKIVYSAPDGVKGTEAVEFDGGRMIIDFDVTPEIEAEGYARELIRRIQQMRKDMKLNVEQYINCDVNAEPRIVELIGTWAEHISAEVRARKLTFTDSPGGDEVKAWDVMEKNIEIGISLAEQ
jgi:isoleucyl-tRNA synthetase